MTPPTEFTVKLPTDFRSANTSEEYFILEQTSQEQKIMLHDYQAIYCTPGLYEHVLINKLQCQSPEIISAELVEAVKQAGENVAELRILEIGAGVGLVGQALHQQGVGAVYGLDILEEAAELANRNYPHAFEHYFVENICYLADETQAILQAAKPNALVVISALNITHLPSEAFSCAFNMIALNGWVAFNLNQLFLQENETTGYAKFIQTLIADGILELFVNRPYQHRLYVNGEPLNYVMIIARKRKNIIIP